MEILKYIFFFDWSGLIGFHSGYGDAIRGMWWILVIAAAGGMLGFLAVLIVLAVLDVSEVKQGNLTYIVAGIMYGLLIGVAPYVFQIPILLLWRHTSRYIAGTVTRAQQDRLSGITTNRRDGKKYELQRRTWRRMTEEEKAAFKEQEWANFRCRTSEARTALVSVYGLVVFGTFLMNQGILPELLNELQMMVKTGENFWIVFGH